MWARALYAGLCWGSRGVQKPQRLDAGRALERGVKVNVHVGTPRPLYPTLASWVSSAQVQKVRDSRRIPLEYRDSYTEPLGNT